MPRSLVFAVTLYWRAFSSARLGRLESRLDALTRKGVVLIFLRRNQTYEDGQDGNHERDENHNSDCDKSNTCISFSPLPREKM